MRPLDVLGGRLAQEGRRPSGTFPKAVLLRKKMVRDDGQVSLEFADTDEDFVREKKGRIWRLNNWGLCRLAYKIKKATDDNYILINFEIQARYINDFKTLLNKDERIIRHLIMKRDEAITEDCPPPPEFHALRAQQYMDDEYEENDDNDEEEEEQEMDAGIEPESGGYDDDDLEGVDEPEIISIDEANQGKYEDNRRRNRMLKAKKYAVEKVLR